MRAEAAVRAYLSPALEQAVAAHRDCPLLPVPYEIVACLCGLKGDPEADAAAIDGMRALRPAEARRRLTCGILEAQAGRFPAAAADWRQALTHDPRLTNAVLMIAREHMALPYIVEQVLPDVPRVLLTLAEASRSEPYFRRLLQWLIVRLSIARVTPT